MNIKVLYHSSTGNTKKLAETIADTLNISAEPIEKDMSALSTPIDLLFIGDGIYFGKPNKNTTAFINQLNPKIVKNVAVFATYGGQTKIGSDIQKLLKDKGLQVLGKPFICKGQSWVFINRNHPNNTELKEVAKFAKKSVERLGS